MPIAAALIAGKPLAPALRALLLVALHQLEYSRNPPEATVSSAVDAARLLHQPRATGLINALLRRFLREREALLAQRAAGRGRGHRASGVAAASACATSWPEQWRQIIAANNAHPPMTLRVDLSRIARESYQAQLAASGLDARALVVAVRPHWCSTGRSR